MNKPVEAVLMGADSGLLAMSATLDVLEYFEITNTVKVTFT